MSGAIVFVIFLVIVFIVFLLSLEQKESKQDYGVKSLTQNGEEVKSISEKKIANYFKENKINYVYEKDLLS